MPDDEVSFVPSKVAVHVSVGGRTVAAVCDGFWSCRPVGAGAEELPLIRMVMR